MIQNEYELVIIIRPDVDDAVTLENITKIEAVITDNGGHLLSRDDWGKRKLAYPIDNHLKGHYVLLSFLAPPSLILEVERRMRLADPVIRFLTVNKVDAVDVEPRVAQAAEQQRLRDEERAKRAAESEDDDSDGDGDNDSRDHASN